jgi:hypothetical protein
MAASSGGAAVGRCGSSGQVRIEHLAARGHRVVAGAQERLLAPPEDLLGTYADFVKVNGTGMRRQRIFPISV